jgi:single-strand DNA-binding protein
MAEGINNCTFAGTVGKDPELKGRDGNVLKFSIACNERRKDGDNWVDHCEWVPITILGKRASALANIIRKGSQVAVVGKFRTSKYEKDGQTRYSTEIVADTIALMGGKRDDSGGGSRSASGGGERAAPEPAGSEPEEDFPFF